LGMGMGMHLGKNPIRKVVTLLQKIQKRVTAEGEKADKLFDEYMCYCKKAGKELTDTVAAAEAKVPDLQSAIEAASSKKSQLEEEIKSKRADREAAQKTMSEATSLRTKSKAAFDKEIAEARTNYDALKKAVSSLSKGMGSGFLQTSAAQTLRAAVSNEQGVMEADREFVLEFLSRRGHDRYNPQSGEIVGILKQMGDEMVKTMEEMEATETDSIAEYEALVAAKTKEIAVQSQFIEIALQRVADLGVEVAMHKGDLEDTSESLVEDKKFLAGLEQNCAGRKGIHEQEKRMRAEEVVALGDTVKILNDDDALDLFKKTLPSQGTSFLQVQVSEDDVRSEAREIVDNARKGLPAHSRARLDFLFLALRGKQVGLNKVSEVIDKLVAMLKKEQREDDDKKEYCVKQLGINEDKKKLTSRAISDLETVIAEGKESVEALDNDIKALKESIIDLDKNVAEATNQRKKENAEFKELIAENGAAKELIVFAKNRLAKFYNAKLHKPAAKKELARDDRIVENFSGGEAFMQLSLKARSRSVAAPPPPPEVAGAYMKKTEESGGVVAMMDLLVQDLDKEMTIAKTEEKDDQAAYEKSMADAAEKRAQDSKALTDKEAARAGVKAKMEEAALRSKSKGKESAGIDSLTLSLHKECDFIVEYADKRRQLRADEVDSLNKAKAVLNGADYSFLQTGSASTRARKFLLRSG